MSDPAENGSHPPRPDVDTRRRLRDLGNYAYDAATGEIGLLIAQRGIVGLFNELWRDASAAEADNTPTFATLADLLQRPELLKPPECVIPRFAYRGRGMLVSAPDKSGKSTALAQATAVKTRGGWFLGDPVERGRVLWVGLEEATGDAVRRFDELGADPDQVRLLVTKPRDLLARMADTLREWPADAVIVDTLTEWARITQGTVPGDGDNAGWAGVTRPMIDLARSQSFGLVLLHHVRKVDGQSRGAGDIAASVDALLELKLPDKGEDPTVRHFTGRGRWPVEPFSVALRNGRYEMANQGPGPSLDARVLLHVQACPGASLTEVRKMVGGRGSAVDAAVRNLLGRGALENLGTEERMKLHMPTGQGRLVVVE